MARLKPVKAEVTILVTLHHWKANRNLCNTRVQDFFFFYHLMGIKNAKKINTNHTEQASSENSEV